jgi:hypothetical protein
MRSRRTMTPFRAAFSISVHPVTINSFVMGKSDEQPFRVNPVESTFRPEVIINVALTTAKREVLIVRRTKKSENVAFGKAIKCATGNQIIHHAETRWPESSPYRRAFLPPLAICLATALLNRSAIWCAFLPTLVCITNCFSCLLSVSTRQHCLPIPVARGVTPVTAILNLPFLTEFESVGTYLTRRRCVPHCF